jgi:NADPH-dependent 2,4-dienoyl-CoA reductase/sulfur reductase-like enzyme
MKKEKVDIAVIGGVAAGTSAAAAAVRESKNSKVVLFEKDKFISYGGCGIPYYVEGLTKSYKDIVVFTPEGFQKSKGVDVRILHEVTFIDPVNKTLKVRNLENSEDITVFFDKLIISTGAKATMPKIEGLKEGERIFKIRTLQDAIRLVTFLKDNAPESAVILGGGYIGLEMAEALAAHNIKVTIVEMMDHVMPTADDQMSEMIEKELLKNNVKVMTKTKLNFVEETEESLRLSTTNGVLESDMLLVSVGVIPEVELAKASGIETSVKGAIKVKADMSTNVDDVYSCGDCATAIHRVTGEDVYIPLGTTANKQGRIAGKNAVGKSEEFKGVLGTAVTKIFGLEYARTGLTYKEAAEKFKVGTALVSSKSKAHYYPGSRDVQIMLVYEKGSGKLLGAQMAGGEISKRIDIVAAAISAGMDVEELSSLDLAYAPPFSPVWDPVLVAANVAKKGV